MSARHSTPVTPRSKPAKPYPDFPLFPHAAGYWAKKVRGKMIYFGPWADPDGALAKWEKDKDKLLAGSKVRQTCEVTIEILGVKYLAAKKDKLAAAELAPRTYLECKATVWMLRKEFGRRRLVEDLDVDDFAALRNKMAKKWGPVSIHNAIGRVRGVFKFGLDSGLYRQAVIFGPGFARPSKRTLRLERKKQPKKLFTEVEVGQLLGGADVQFKAMILLGLNCGFGNADVGRVKLEHLDLVGDWSDYHREKTGIDRRCKLWPETVAAIKAWLKVRPKPKAEEHRTLVFLTQPRRGPVASWHKEGDSISNPLSAEFGKLMKSLKLNSHRGFYCLRHTTETIGGGAKDQIALDFIMGHAGEDMASRYREEIEDSRLEAVAEHVRKWAFGEKAKV